MMLYERLYNSLSAVEALSVGIGAKMALNKRGERVLRYLRDRRRRELARLDQAA